MLDAARIAELQETIEEFQRIEDLLAKGKGVFLIERTDAGRAPLWTRNLQGENPPAPALRAFFQDYRDELEDRIRELARTLAVETLEAPPAPPAPAPSDRCQRSCWYSPNGGVSFPCDASCDGQHAGVDTWSDVGAAQRLCRCAGHRADEALAAGGPTP